MKAPNDIFRLALRSAVAGGYLLPQQAGRIARKISLDVADLPGREPLSIDIDPKTWQLIFLELLALSINGQVGLPRVAWREAQRRIAAWKIEELMRAHELLQDKFEQRNRVLAGLLFAGLIPLAAWRVAFWEMVKRLNMAQAALGAGRVPQVVNLAEVLKREAGYVDGFAQAIFAGKVATQAEEELQKRAPVSEGAIRNRSDIYSGTARGLFYEELEAARPPEWGWIIQYIPRDDGNTCTPCHNAAGYYLAGLGPKPGQICEGGGKCRCVRRSIFLPDVYRELVGVRVG